MNDKLKKIYAVFHPAPLKTGQEDLYVDLDAVRGDSPVVRHLSRKIRLASETTCQILTGHEGSGKSTELWRLQHELQEPEDESEKYFVVLVRADDHMDRNDVDFPEVLIAIIRQLADDLQQRENINLKPGYFKGRWERLKKLMSSEVSFDGLQLGAGMGKLALTVKNSPDARFAIRELFDPDTTNWLVAANDVIGSAKQELVRRGYAELIIIVDDLDKMITRTHEPSGRTTTEYLFVHRAAQMTAFDCHVVYTMPLDLAYSHQQQTIKNRYGGDLPVVPVTKIATQPPNSRSYGPGLKQFRSIIEKRLTSIGAKRSELFASKRVETELIKLSGGQLTELMMLIREAIITDDLPIGSAALKRCREALKRSYMRFLRPEDHWPILKKVRKDCRFRPTAETELAFRELLKSRALLLYRNDEEWYGLHPVVADIEPPQPEETNVKPGE